MMKLKEEESVILSIHRFYDFTFLRKYFLFSFSLSLSLSLSYLSIYRYRYINSSFVKIKVGKGVVDDLVCLCSIKFHYLLLVTDVRYLLSSSIAASETTGTTILPLSAKRRFGLIKAATLRKL